MSGLGMLIIIAGCFMPNLISDTKGPSIVELFYMYKKMCLEYNHSREGVG